MESHYWQVRRGSTLVWDGESEADAREVAARSPEYTLVRETWSDSAGGPVLEKTEEVATG